MDASSIERMIANSDVKWLSRASDYQADRAYAYFWLETLSSEDVTDEEKLILFDKGHLELVDEDNDPYDFVKFLRAKTMRDTWDASGGDYDPIAESEFEIIINIKMRNDFNDFAKDWIDLTDDEAYEEFYIKYSPDFKKSWIQKIIKETPTDEQIFGNIWFDEEDPKTEEVIEPDLIKEPGMQEAIKTSAIIAGSNFVWLNEDNGEIKVSRNQPPGNYVLIENVNTGYKDTSGKTIIVPSTLDGVMDWWTSIGKSSIDLNKKDSTTLIIKNGGSYSKDWIRRYFFVKDKDGDLIISY
jgi:hypothetical protein